MPTTLRGRVAETGLELPSDALDRLARYRDLIVEHGARFNLTAVRQPEAIERRHLVESLFLARELDRLGLLPDGARVIDIGSGAGLPGLPLKIAFPGLRLTLLEAVFKKCRFLELAIRELGLVEVTVTSGRAEDVARRPGERASYDLALARAVAPLNVLLEYALPFLKVDGHFAGTKGSAAATELRESEAAMRALGGQLMLARPFQAPGGLPQTLVVVRQAVEAPAIYPRRAGIPAKRPIG